jgi:CubicO group peptidase (beta-lactamase class C family)
MVTLLEAFRRSAGVPAIGAAVVSPASIRAVAVGCRSRSRGEAVTTDDMWHIGSCAKAMTAALVGRHVEAGRLSWDVTLPEALPDVEMSCGWTGVTLREVLTHRSGLPANLERMAMRAALLDLRPVREQRVEAAWRALAKPPHRRGRFRYSNLGYVVVGAVVERLADASFEEVLARDLLQPLAIDRFGFGAPHGAHPWGHRPRWGGFGRGPAVPPAVSSPPHPADNPAVMTPAGRLHLPLDEWAKFIREFLLPGGAVLSRHTVETLLAPAAGPGPQQAMGWVATKKQGVAFAQQGSNRRWVATALVSAERDVAALVVCNDGRTRVLTASVPLAARLLG